MKCPACSHQLSELQIGTLRVDVCRGGCGGVWFDLFELQQVDDVSESAGEALIQISRIPAMRVDPIRKRECPRCQQMKLKRRMFSPTVAVEVDECPACGGFWLDAGELEQIRLTRNAVEKSKSDKQQSGFSPAAIRALYRLKTADRGDI